MVDNHRFIETTIFGHHLWVCHYKNFQNFNFYLTLPFLALKEGYDPHWAKDFDKNYERYTDFSFLHIFPHVNYM